MNGDPDDLAVEAQQIVDVAGAEAKAETVAAFYLRLRHVKVPAAIAHDLTVHEFYPGWWEEDG